jgi:RND family efflux transporter MFP subunit
MRQRFVALALLPFALSACRKQKAPEPSVTTTTKSMRVETVVIDERPLPKTVTITGTLQADQRSELAANAAGRVIRTFVERGDHVKAGALLAQLDSRAASITRTEAQAQAQSMSEQLAAVRADCARYEALVAQGAISQQAFDRQASQCRTQSLTEEAARARAADATRILSDTAIRAPFAGVISERAVSVGDYAAQEVRDHINTALRELPKGVDPPIVSKLDPDAAPVLLVTLRAPGTVREVTELADKKVRRQIESINGVGQVSILGGRKRQVNVWLARRRSAPCFTAFSTSGWRTRGGTSACEALARRSPSRRSAPSSACAPTP